MIGRFAGESCPPKAALGRASQPVTRLKIVVSPVRFWPSPLLQIGAFRTCRRQLGAGRNVHVASTSLPRLLDLVLRGDPRKALEFADHVRIVVQLPRLTVGARQEWPTAQSQREQVLGDVAPCGLDPIDRPRVEAAHLLAGDDLAGDARERAPKWSSHPAMNRLARLPSRSASSLSLCRLTRRWCGARRR
jgi:hypothetical protein